MTPREFKAHVIAWAKKVNVAPGEIHIRKMSRKWASCSSKGRLTFDRSLLGEPEEVLNKVIVHELLHLKYPNHGKLFNAMLNTYLSNRHKANIAQNDLEMKANPK